MSIVYGIKPEKKYFSFFGDSAPTFQLVYNDTITYPMISVDDFTLLFGVKEGVGVLRDVTDYITDEKLRKSDIVISVKASKEVKDKTIMLHSCYRKLFENLYFKCLPVSTLVESLLYLDVYLSVNKKVTVHRGTIKTELSNYFHNMFITPKYNDMIFPIQTSYGLLNIKIFNVGYKHGIINETTLLHLKNNDYIELVFDLPRNNKHIEKVSLEPPLVPLEPLVLEQKPLCVDLSKLKVGGLKDQIIAIANVIRPWGMKKEHLDKIGMDEFEKGIMLFGNPGTGKTLIARELSKVLGVQNFVVVNGPECISKYIGESEANIRQILQNYTDDLKVVFFDEFDCIARERNSGNNAGAQTANNIVNQILSIMDGVDKKNNILIIAATNRLDVIDTALLRPGRFGLCLHIGLPDKPGRLEIFNIHLLKNIQCESLDINVSLSQLVEQSENYTGAEIKGICKKARELALSEAAPDLSNLSNINEKLLILKERHFNDAFKLVKCQFSGNGLNAGDLLPIGQGDTGAIDAMSKFCTHAIPASRIYTFLLCGKTWSRKSSSCRVLCEQLRTKYDMIIIVTQNLTTCLDKVDFNTNKNMLIILDCLENLCGILNTHSYNNKHIEYINQLTNRIVKGKVILIATMRTQASDMFSIINPSFEWNEQYMIS
jgi:hypothetical protein